MTSDPAQSQTKNGSEVLRSRIGRRALLLTLVSATVPLVLLAAFALTQVTDSLLDQAHRRLHADAKAAAVTLMDRLVFVDEQLDNIAARIAQGTTSLEQVEQTSPTVARYLSGLVWLDDNGARIGTAFAPPAWAPDLRPDEEQHTATGASLLRSWRGGPLLIRRVQTQRGPTWLAGKIAPAFLWDTGALLNEQQRLIVLDDQRRLLFESEQGAASPELFEAINDDARAGRFTWIDPNTSEARIGGYWQMFGAPRFGANLTPVLTHPESDVLASYDSFQRFFLLVVALALCTVVYLSILHVRSTLAPITKLQTATRAIGNGDLSARVRIHSHDEFEDLGDAFNEMVDRLVDSQAQRDEAEQARLEALQEAVAAAETEANFLRNVSHEMRTPLTGIRSAAEILRDHVGGDEDARVEFAGIIVQESDRLAKILGDVLDISRIEAGQVEWNFVAFGLRRNLGAVVEAMRAAAVDRDVELRFADGDDGSVWGDPQWISKIWANLLSNAIKFTEPGTTVEVSAAFDDDAVTVSIRDQGPGIDPANHDSVFDRFQQISDDLITDKPSGTGLGLAIAKQIAVHHDATIEVDSSLGHGACFRIRMPLLTDTKAPPTAGGVTTHD